MFNSQGDKAVKLGNILTNRMYLKIVIFRARESARDASQIKYIN
jgi:hypothetical protein